MKKLLFSFSLFIFLFIFDFYEVKAQDILENHYVINGVDVESEVKLTNDQLQFLYETAILKDSTEISPFNIDGGGNAGTIIDGPHYTVVSNFLERYSVTLFATWIGTKLPNIRPIAYSLATVTFYASEHMPDRFVGAWVWKVYDTAGYVPAYKKYATAVEYTGNSYRDIKKITVYDAGAYY